MRKLWTKLTNIINKVLSTKIGKFLFEVVNTIGLLVLVIYLFAHVKIIFAFTATFFLLSNILLLINKYTKRPNE